jgi:hypothetical protein
MERMYWSSLRYSLLAGWRFVGTEWLFQDGLNEVQEGITSKKRVSE